MTSPSWRVVLAEFLEDWPRVVLALALGTLMGYLLAPWLPFSYRAEVPLEVRFDYDGVVLFPPELLYIQTERVREVLESPAVLEELHRRLTSRVQEAFPSPQRLARALTVDWRLTQRWYLVAYARDRETARTLASLWARVVEDQLPQWRENTRIYHTWKRKETLTLWEELHLARWAQAARRARSFFREWLQAPDQDPSRPLPAYEREQVLFWAAFAQYPADAAVLAHTPGPEAPRSEYRAWVQERVLPRLETLEPWLEEARAQLRREREQAREQRLALEATTLTLWLPVELEVVGGPQVYGVPQRSAGALWGGVFGLVVAGVLVLARATRRRASEP